jgi:UPF0755 protein
MDEPKPAGRSGHERRRRRVALLVVLVVFFLVAGGMVAAIGRYRGCKEPPAADGTKVTFEVPTGASGRDVAERLAQRGLVRCGGFVGNLLLRGTGKANRILAGSYDLAVGLSLDQIVAALTTPPPPVPTVRLTVPEGLRIRTTYPGERSISSEVHEQTGISAKRFARLAESGRYDLPLYLPKGTSAEGFLFPDTYQLVKHGLTANVVIRQMLQQFETVATQLDLVGGAKRLGLTPYQVVIVASMIEREAQVEQDRPKIASVIYNRLARHMTLGIDATLLYDDPSPDGRLTTPDLKTDTPYNTRINLGLPPTPIASPGEASLDAALHPDATNYLYYVACPPDGPGVHRFAQTYAEHLRNVKACLG